MATAGKISIALADDHAMLRKGLVKLLQTLGNYECLFDVDSGDQVIEELKKHKIPDVLILDVRMEGKGGLETTRWINQHYPQIKILALSMFSEEETILSMIQAGARGYITKNSEPEKLVSAINILYDQGVYLPENLSTKVFDGIKNNILGKPGYAELNDREKKFLSLLCEEMSYKEIAEKMFLSPRTIEDYSKSLIKKIGVKGKAGLIVYAMNNGLKV